MAGWVGLHFPGGTPPAQLERLQVAAQQALREPLLLARLAEQGAQIAGSGAEAYRDFILAETQRWSGVIRAAGIEPE
jgi:tripartite-type tricarboxylate transporter receptor subunit TctC